MSFLKKLFGSKQAIVINNYADFWKWFQQHEQSFFKIVKEQDNIDVKFFSKLGPVLNQLNEQFYYVTGMFDDNTAELIITAEGSIKTFVFVEELIAAAPAIRAWKFTAHKPPCNIESMQIKMDGIEFDDSKLSFYSNELVEYPDEIDITVVHQDFDENNKNTVTNGTYIYLDNALGELTTATLIDSIEVKGPDKDDKELIPITKLKDFLLWREKEFVEKYDGERYNTKEDNYSCLEAEDDAGLPMVAVVNQDLLNWDAKSSHPWMMVIEINYNGKDNNGMPDDDTYELMNSLDEKLEKTLPDSEGYLNIGRETYNSKRKIYFACKEFRNLSKKSEELLKGYYSKLDVMYEIFKDKYWVNVNHLNRL